MNPPSKPGTPLWKGRWRVWTPTDLEKPDWGDDNLSKKPNWMDIPGMIFIKGPKEWTDERDTLEFVVAVEGHPEIGALYFLIIVSVAGGFSTSARAIGKDNANLSVTLFEKTPILCALQAPEADAEFAENVNQLILSTFSRTVANSAHLLHILANRPSINDGASNFASNVLINKLCKSLSSGGPTSSRIERSYSFKASPSQ